MEIFLFGSWTSDNSPQFHQRMFSCSYCTRIFSFLLNLYFSQHLPYIPAYKSIWKTKSKKVFICYFQLQCSINKTCCSSEDKFITEDTMAKVLQFIQKVCLHINKFVYARVRKCERKIEIGNRDRLRIARVSIKLEWYFSPCLEGSLKGV